MMLKIKRVKNIDLTAVWGCLFCAKIFKKRFYCARRLMNRSQAILFFCFYPRGGMLE